MTGSELIRRAGVFVLVGVVMLLLLGQALGQPVLVGYVETGSMEPRLDPGDGFVAIPTPLAGELDSGDVVVFRAEEIRDGGLTTHRITGETERGFITKGDANPFTDQDGGEPPVKRAQIVAVVWRPGGQVFVVPELGTFVTGVQSIVSSVQTRLAVWLGIGALRNSQGLAYLLFGLSVAGYLLAEYRDHERTDRSRSRSRNRGSDARVVVLALAGVVVLAATAAMVVPAGTQEYGVVSAEFDSPGPRVIAAGTTDTTTHSVANHGVVPVVAYLEPASEGIAVDPNRLSVPRQSARESTVTLSVPPETGYYRRYLVEHRYLAVLPKGHIDALYRVHPWIPILVIDALVGVPFYLVGIRLVGTGRIHSRSRDGPSRLERLLFRFT